MFMIYHGGIQSIAIHDGLSRHTPSSNWVLSFHQLLKFAQCPEEIASHPSYQGIRSGAAGVVGGWNSIGWRKCRKFAKVDSRSCIIYLHRRKGRKKEPLLIPNLSDLTHQDVNFVMLQVTATVERAMSVLEKEGFMWNFQMTPCFAQVAVTPMQNWRDKKTSVWPRFLLGKNWLCQRLNFPCWNSILILPLPQLLEQATKSGREQGLETKYWEERRNVGLCFLDCISFFNWLELISDVCSCPG